MVGWHLLLLLVVEIAAYGAIGRYAHVVWGWNNAASVALAVGIYLIVRILLVGAEFVLARWKGGPVPDALQVSSGRLFTMYLRELGGWLLMFSLTLPFVLSRRSVIDRTNITKSPAPPIILIHGLACNRGTWFWFRRQLEARGHCAFTIDCTPWFARIESYPEQLAKAIDEVCGATGARKVVLIGHSMGGLIARAYIDRMGADKIERTITLGTPHQGTWMTRFGFTPNILDMAEGSAWLTGLRAREGQRSSNPYANFTCIFTHHDNLVTPHINATLPGAAEIAVSGIGHLSLTLSPLIIERVLAVLAGKKRTD
ncbi:MAG: alpha/beta fold hydrolase [Casimicrobiaceae bacterium]